MKIDLTEVIKGLAQLNVATETALALYGAIRNAATGASVHDPMAQLSDAEFLVLYRSAVRSFRDRVKSDLQKG